jgi:hypothetical protein
METAIAITSLAISGLTALGSILAYYKCKSCKGFCFECDCFPEAPGQSVVIDNRHESPNIVIARQESPNVFVRHESPNIVIARHESPNVFVRHESPNIVIARHESPVVFVRQDARHESPIGWRLDNSANLSELTQYFERGRKAKPDYDVSII